MIYVMGWSAKVWNQAKKTLSFAKVMNDGDDEGSFLSRPSADQERG
jgi:hypothetical protein